ncbi:MAG: cob(I)yrinic acid a,c-diamide adenosyltransferase [Patescibacteria group bacterium]
MPIYTRTGDTGTTALFGGTRVLKCNDLVDVYGSIDELNSWIGFVSSKLNTIESQEFLSRLQSDLFTIGSNFAGFKTDISHLHERVLEMEARIDAMDKALPKLTKFILPGGSELGAVVHLARGVCRRVERQTVALHQTQPVDLTIISYLNRLSDFLFMLARFVNKELGATEVIWSAIDRVNKKK